MDVLIDMTIPLGAHFMNLKQHTHCKPVTVISV